MSGEREQWVPVDKAACLPIDTPYLAREGTDLYRVYASETGWYSLSPEGYAVDESPEFILVRPSGEPVIVPGDES